MKIFLQVMIVSGVGLLLLTTAHGATVRGRVDDDLWEHVNKTCLGSVCNETVNLQQLDGLKAHMKSDTNPCENFHKYACGNRWKEQSHNKTMMQFADQQLTDEFLQYFEKKLRGEPTEECENKSSEVLEKILQYYEVCKRSEREQQLSLKGYFELMRAQGMWRLGSFNWLETLAQLGRYDYGGHFVEFYVKPMNATHHRMTVLPHDSHKKVNLTADIYEILREYSVKTYDQLRAEFQKLETDLEEIVNESYAKYTSNSEKEDVDMMENFTFAELKHKCPAIGWTQYLKLQMGRRMLPDDIISVDDLNAVKKIANLLNHGSTELSFLYTLTRFLNHLQQLPHSIVTLGASGQNCVRHMRKTLHLPMNYVYECAYYARVRPGSDRLIFDVFRQLKEEFAHTLTQNKMHLSSETLTYLQAKLSTLRLNLGNLPLNASSEFYVEYLRPLNVTANFYYNHLQALELNNAQQHRLHDLHSSTSPWHTFNYHIPDMQDNLDASPYYYVLKNIIIFPHAYLQTPFYDQSYWPALLYGDLANTLGHELIHAFDNYFLAYDQFGNPSEVYKEIEANANYQRNIACLSEGTSFLSERIADISGTRLALNTFMRDPLFRRRNGKLYFLQFSQFFCGDEDLESFQAQDPNHDLDSLRLNYALMHTPEFAEIFACPVGSPMNPAKKCELW